MVWVSRKGWLTPFAEVVYENPPGGQYLVAVAAENAPAAVTHRDRPTRVVYSNAGVRFEHAGDGAVLEKLWSHCIIVDTFASASDLAEEEPFIQPVVYVITFSPATTVAG